jgi:hypothetical protein
MRASAFDPPAIPPGFWERAEVRQALRKRDMGALFRLVEEHTGLSHTRLGTAVGLTQGRVSEVINGTRRIAATHVFQRIADGLGMPDPARMLLGLSPRHTAAITRPVSTRRAQPGQNSELQRQITAARSIDATVIRVLQGETDTIRLLDRRLGALAVAGKLEAHISQVETSLCYWHGNVFHALQTVDGILFDLDTAEPGPEQARLLKAVREFDAYLRANAGRIPNYGERHRAGEAISTAFTESAVNQVISKRMVKKQQMRWTPRGAHLLLQVRTRVLNDQLADDFHRWYPGLSRTLDPVPLAA